MIIIIQSSIIHTKKCLKNEKNPVTKQNITGFLFILTDKLGFLFKTLGYSIEERKGQHIMLTYTSKSLISF